jgi:GxxExxY protein
MVDQGKLVELNKITDQIIGCAIEVHKQMGPGLLEEPYELCLAYEFTQHGIKFVRQGELPIFYKEVHLDCKYRLDFLVEDLIVVELKSISTVLPVHTSQLITYMKLAKCDLGLLLNFNVPRMKDGIKRIVLN